jgi:hypothetical protein
VSGIQGLGEAPARSSLSITHSLVLPMLALPQLHIASDGPQLPPQGKASIPPQFQAQEHSQERKCQSEDLNAHSFSLGGAQEAFALLTLCLWKYIWF